MDSKPLLVATNQQLRLKSYGLMFMGGLFAANLSRLLPDSGAGMVLANVVGTVGGLVSLSGVLLALIAIRCPGCGLRWVRWSISNQPFTRWLPWLGEFHQCPKCSYSVSPRPALLQPNSSLQRDRDR
jgi:hypothetical protein